MTAKLSESKEKSVTPGGSTRAGTVGWLEDLHAKAGPDQVRAALADCLPPKEAQGYHVLRPDEGQATLRTDVNSDEGITYQSFNPPFWDQPYSLTKASFEPKQKETYIYHAGEEILVPTSGRIQYRLFWTPGGRPAAPEELPTPVEPGESIRINPQLPHQTWAAGGKPATAWMIFRHFSESATSINLDVPDPLDSEEMRPSPRRMTADELSEPGRYALVAWGIAERVRFYRDRAGLRIVQLAAACAITSSHLSRIENAETNVAVDILIRIARILRISPTELVSPPTWAHLREQQPAASEAMTSRDILCPPDFHELHARRIVVPEGPFGDRTELARPRAHSCWILLSGRIILEIGTQSELLDAGSVIHFCRNVPVRGQVLRETARILAVTCCAPSLIHPKHRS